ncbi:MAG: DUF3800 domain-containing protein [Deltaproteobacteria bacterium]|nr:DUF3800 domain-containing protein [Deltaproteobacteria bacterium]
MVALKGYFDDSGDEEDRQHKACSLSGYIGTFDDWDKFENGWIKVLDENNIPYLHMKEFAHFRGPFEKYKGKETERKELLISLISVIRESNLFGISSSIRLKGLHKFNNERNVFIEAYPFNLYWNMMQISHKWNKTPIQLTVDKSNNVEYKISKGKSYAKTDLYYPNCHKRLIILPLNDEGFTFREILPMQAADLLAWECRKDATMKHNWIEEKTLTDDDLIRFRYHRIYEKKDGKLPYSRMSLIDLLRTIPTNANIIDYRDLHWIDVARKHIWP